MLRLCAQLKIYTEGNAVEQNDTLSNHESIIYTAKCCEGGLERGVDETR